MVVLRGGGEEVARWPLVPKGPVDLAVVDELARLQLLARRRGHSIAVLDASDELWELVELAGLAQVLPRAELREAAGEAEEGEQLGVEEVVVPDDPVT